MPQNNILENIKSLISREKSTREAATLTGFENGLIGRKASPISWQEMECLTDEGRKLSESSVPRAAREIASAYVCGNKEEGYLAMITNKAVYSYTYSKMEKDIEKFLEDPDALEGKSIVFGTNEYCRPKNLFAAFEEDAKRMIVANAQLNAQISDGLSKKVSLPRIEEKSRKKTLKMISEGSRAVAANFQSCLHKNELGRQAAREKYPELAKYQVHRDRMKESIQLMEEQEKKASRTGREKAARCAR